MLPVLCLWCKLLQRILEHPLAPVSSPFLCNSWVRQAYSARITCAAEIIPFGSWWCIQTELEQVESSLLAVCLTLLINSEVLLIGMMTAIMSPFPVQCSNCCVQSWICPENGLCAFSGVRCQPCRCRRAWHETCSSVCRLWRVSSDHIWAKEQNGRSSESKRSEKTLYDISHRTYQTDRQCTSQIYHLKLSWNVATWAPSVIPSHSFYSDAFCEWQWKEPCRQCKSCKLHQAPNLEGLQRATKKRLTPRRKRGFNETLRVQLVDVLTFELALPGLGRHLWWGNRLLTENTIL